MPVVPCSHEHIRRNLAVKVFSGEIRGNLISEPPPFGRLPYGEPNVVTNAIGYSNFYSRSHEAVIRVYDAAGNVIETHEHAGDFRGKRFVVRVDEKLTAFVELEIATTG